MNEFPKDFNKDTLKKFRVSKQKTLVNNVRKSFYDTVMKDSKDGLQSSKLLFPPELHREYRISLCNELIINFHAITVIFSYNRPHISSAHPKEKRFFGYPDDEFLSEFVSSHRDKSINIEAVVLEY